MLLNLARSETRRFGKHQMKALRRYDIRHAHYFVTVVTLNRTPVLVENACLFLPSWRKVKPLAWVLTSDHFHAIVPVNDVSISVLIHDFKLRFRYAYQRLHGPGRIWQHRFWDHIIRDEEDFLHHLDYIHFNPVKHGLAQAPGDYQHSSFREWEAQGYYDDIQVNAQSAEFDGNFGE